jgi:hypothetical protein
MCGKLRWLALAVLLAAAACSTASGGSAAPTSSASLPSPLASRPAPHVRAFTRCHNAHYFYKMVEGLSPQTGEHGFFVQLMYAGHHRCSISGYPKVEFIAADGSRLPFHYRNNGGPYLTLRRPTPINLHPVDSFMIAIAKYRCDIQTQKSAKYVVIRMPGGGTPVRINLQAEGVTSIDYCAEAPSEIVYLSPIEGPESHLFQ